MARLVRCPKCHKLLVEYPNVPVYQCGGCGIALRAKNQNAPPESPQTNHPESQSDHGFSDTGSTSSVRESTPYPSTMQSPKMENEGEEITLPSIGSPSSNVRNNQHDKGECSERSELAVEEGGSGASRLSVSTGDMNFESENQQVDFFQEDNEQVENPPKPSEPDCLNLTSEVEQAFYSVGHSIASEEDMADGAQYEGVDVLKSPATIISSHAYDGSISSSDDAGSVHTPHRHLGKSRRTFKGTYTEAKLKSRTLASTSSNERNGSRMMRNINAIRDDIYDELGGGSSFDSQEFQSVQNWMALQKEGPSGNLPKGSFSGDLHDKVELLRKIDEVRDQLAKICVAREEAEIYHPSRGIHHDMQQLDHRSRANLFDHPARASYQQAKNATQKYQLPTKHFSGQAYCSCMHCLEEQRLHMMPSFHGHGSYRSNVHDLDSHSSSSGSLHKHDHESVKSQLKDKPRRHCRPISGASPFVICKKCTKLLQLPADFLISRRKMHKLQCGGCSEVLSLPFPSKAPTLSEVVHSSIEVDDPSQYNDYQQGGDPVSEPDPPVPHFSRNSSEGRAAKADAVPQLHRLMGYPSASDLLYQDADIDKGYESKESIVRRSYRPSEQSFRGRGSSSPYHEHIGNATSPDSVVMHKEGESLRSRSTRPGLPRPGM